MREEMCHDLNVRLLGRFEIDAAVNIESLRAQELLSYLFINAGRPHHGDTLAGLFWGEYPTRTAKRYLSKALHQIQTSSERVDLLYVEPMWIQINPVLDIWIDVHVLENAVRVSGDLAALTPARVERIQHAVALYRGPLLDGWYHDWCLVERERLRHLCLTLLDTLVMHYERHGQHAAGIDCAQQILKHDRARERTHRALMRLYCMAGSRTDALRQYTLCTKILADELDVAPGARTTRLWQAIRQSEFTNWIGPDAPAGDTANYLLTLRQHLQESINTLHRDLDTVDGLVHRLSNDDKPQA